MGNNMNKRFLLFKKRFFDNWSPHPLLLLKSIYIPQNAVLLDNKFIKIWAFGPLVFLLPLIVLMRRVIGEK